MLDLGEIARSAMASYGRKRFTLAARSMSRVGKFSKKKPYVQSKYTRPYYYQHSRIHLQSDKNDDKLPK